MRPLVIRKKPVANRKNVAVATQLKPPPNFRDPRLRHNFDPAAWPLCNGSPGPPCGASDLHERRCIEFLAAYYELNRLNRQLLAARQRGSTEQRIRSLVLKVNKAMVFVEKLEDRYAPVGFFGEPMMKGVFYRDIAFIRPALPLVYPALQSSHIAIPGLGDIPPGELRGKVKIRRFRHGKVDL